MKQKMRVKLAGQPGDPIKRKGVIGFFELSTTPEWLITK